MSFTDLLRAGEVTIFNPTTTGTDRYGNDVVGFDTGTSVPGLVQQLSTDELLLNRDTRETIYMVFLKPDAPVTSLSQLEWQGRRLAVTGDPDLVEDRDGPHHYELTAVRFQG